jgi:hypothetical protein
MRGSEIHNYYSTPGDFARIIVDDPVAVPGPVAGAGLPECFPIGTREGVAGRDRLH